EADQLVCLVLVVELAKDRRQLGFDYFAHAGDHREARLGQADVTTAPVLIAVAALDHASILHAVQQASQSAAADLDAAAKLARTQDPICRLADRLQDIKPGQRR